MKTINLEWKSFNVNLDEVQSEIKSLCPDCCGLSGNKTLDVHITNDEVGQDVVDSIQAYWDGITLASSEATSYQSKEQIEASKAAAEAAALASATSKLSALGLSAEEIAALRG